MSMLLYTFLSNKSVVFNLTLLHIEMDYKDFQVQHKTGSFLGGVLDFLEKQHFQLHNRLVNILKHFFIGNVFLAFYIMLVGILLKCLVFTLLFIMKHMG